MSQPSDTPITSALLTRILDRDGELGPRNAPKEWVEHARNLERVAKQLADALGNAGKQCGEVHHNERDRHTGFQECPVENRIAAALTTWEKLKGET